MSAVEFDLVPGTPNTIHIRGHIETTNRNVARVLQLQTISSQNPDMQPDATREAWTAKVKEALTKSHHDAFVGTFEASKRAREDEDSY